MYTRRLPSGKWQTTIRGADGRRHSKTHSLRRITTEWGREQEAAADRGVFRDPRTNVLTLAEWHRRWSVSSGRLASATRRIYDLRWRQEIEPYLGGWRVSALRLVDLEGWVAQLHADGHTPRAIGQAVTVVQAMLTAAARSDLIPVSPARHLVGPKVVERPPEFYERHEAAALLAAVGEPLPHALVDLDMHVGLRWGELAALRGDRVDWIRGLLHVVDVAEGDGTIREYPKTGKSRRTVPVPPHVMGQLSRLMEGRPREALVFTSARGTLLRHSNWRARVWVPAHQASGVRYRGIHAMRHTAASWLVQAGVDLYRVQALLGHESYKTTERYTHLQTGADDAVLGAWAALDARVTHEPDSGATGKGRI